MQVLLLLRGSVSNRAVVAAAASFCSWLVVVVVLVDSDSCGCGCDDEDDDAFYVQMALCVNRQLRRRRSCKFMVAVVVVVVCSTVNLVSCLAVSCLVLSCCAVSSRSDQSRVESLIKLRRALLTICLLS